MYHTGENLRILWRQVHLACEVGNFGGKGGAINLVKRQLKRIRARNDNEKDLLEWRSLLSSVYARKFASMEGKFSNGRYLKKAIKIQRRLGKDVEKFSPRMLYTRARIFFLAGRFEEAVDIYQKALASDIGKSLQSMFLINTAETFTAMGNIESTNKYYIEALGLAEGVRIEVRIRIYRSYGEFLIKQGHYMDASRYLQLAEDLAKGKMLFVEAARIKVSIERANALSGAVRKAQA